jgi:hypothetical protein
MTARPPVVERMDDAMAEILRKKTPQQRLRIAAGMWRSARVMLRGAIRQQHPDWDEEAVNREIARRISHGEVDHANLPKSFFDNELRAQKKPLEGG